MLGLDSAYALTGNLMDGGGKQKRGKSLKMKRSKGMKRYSVNLFGGAKQFMCTEVEVPPPVVAPVAQVAQPAVPAIQPIRMSGGKMSKKASMYKKMLSNMTVERLQKLAVKRGVKITKKKDGKVVQVKKATLVRKLCECKYGKSKSSKSRKSRKSRK
jgi:hypothetical protein